MTKIIDIDEFEKPPSLYDVYRFLSLKVVKENKAKMSLFTNWILSGQCALLEGPSSSGKTRVMDAVAEIVEDKCLNLEHTGDATPHRLMNEINAAKYVYIPELNKVKPVVIEILKAWGEGKTSEKTVCVVTKAGFRNKKFILDPKPFIFARADENPVSIPQELMNRVVVLNCDASEEQTDAVLDYQADVGENPFYHIKKRQEINIDGIKNHMKKLPKIDYYLHPGAKWLKQIMPRRFTTSRRDFPRYLENTYGITRWHYKDRMRRKFTDLENKEMLLVAPEDMWFNHKIFGEILLASCIRCAQNEQRVLSVVKHNQPVDKKSIQEVLQEHGLNINLQALNRSLKTLTNNGYLSYEKEGNKNVYSISGALGSMEITIEWRELQEFLKDRIFYLINEKDANEYADRYLNEDWYFTDPFTGEEIHPTVDTIKLGDLLELKDMKNKRLSTYITESNKNKENEENERKEKNGQIMLT